MTQSEQPGRKKEIRMLVTVKGNSPRHAFRVCVLCFETRAYPFLSLCQETEVREITN